MARPAHKTTESTRKHAFRSFKDRIETLKIDPSRKLNTRAYDYVETSHFLVTLQHWKEVNLSEDFTNFVFEVQDISQTLPQIIHHQAEIFSLLHDHIEKNDINSIQPLLELMTQFIHDLGPDFMPFYIEYLRMLLKLANKVNPNSAQNMRNTSNVFEWAFNSMAFAFKYLARDLVTDLKATFTEILPVLTSTKNTHISRFCAEAFSFLIKKSKQEVLQNIIDFAFYAKRSELEVNASYRESLAVLFSEAMKNTAETFHSKANLVLSTLVTSALDAEKGGYSQVNTVCDTLLQVFQHGSTESCEKFFILCMNLLDDFVKTSDSLERLCNILNFLITISFVGSGSRVSDWPRLLEIVKHVHARAESIPNPDESSIYSLSASTAHLFAIIVRNSDLQNLNKSFHSMADYLATRPDCRYFLGFYELALMTSGDKALTFGMNKYFQSVVGKMETEEEMLCVARFLIRMEDIPEYDFTNIIIPNKIMKRLSALIKSDMKSLENSSLINLYWKLRLAAYAPPNALDSQMLTSVLDKLESSQLTPSTLLRCLRGITVKLLVSSNSHSKKVKHTFQTVKSILEQSRQSTDYIASLKALVDGMSGENKPLFEADFDYFCIQLASNLSTPNKRLRILTIDCLESIYKFVQKPLPSFLSSMRLVDQVPREVGNANDIKLRIRHSFDGFAQEKVERYEEKLMFVNFILGILSDNFRPCWVSVYESLPKLETSKCSDLLWNQFVQFLQFDYKNQSSSCVSQQPMSIGSTELEGHRLQTSDARLNNNTEVASSTIFQNSSEYEASVYESLIETSSMEFKTNMRSRVISALHAALFVAVQNGSQLVEIVNSLYKPSGISTNCASDWSSKDKLQLLSTFANFNNLRKVENNEMLYSLVLESISSKLTEVQKESLKVIFAFKIPEINKYKDNLGNLLEDKLFRDELQLLVSKESDSKIEDSDKTHVIPIVLRILYGRAKGVTNNQSKNSRKFAIASILPNLPDEYISQFLSITAENIMFTEYFHTKVLKIPTDREVHDMQGYLNMLYEIYNGLGYKYASLLKDTVKPLVFILVSTQNAIDTYAENDLFSKQVRGLRQTGLKCLDHLFKITSGSYNWSEDSDLIFNAIVKPRLEKFAQENLQQPSALLQLMLGWMGSTSLHPFLYYDDFAPVTALMSLLAHPQAKNIVRSEILDFCISAFTRKAIDDENFVTVLAMIVDCLLQFLPTIIKDSEEKEINSRAATLLLLIIESNFVSDQAFMFRLIGSCAAALEKPPTQIAAQDKISILLSLVPIINELECSFESVHELYECASKALRVYKNRDVRECLVKIFSAIGSKFPEYAQVGGLLADLNSYSANNLSEPDFERRLQAFRIINEEFSTNLNAVHWTPLIYCCLFFMNDPDELIIRSNAASTIMSFVSSLIPGSSLDTNEGSHLLHSVVLPHLRKGLRVESEPIRENYVRVLAHLVENYNLTDEFSSMKVLLSDDDESDFFKNFIHIQLPCRLKAIKQLQEVESNFTSNVIYHYILPMTEVYTTTQDPKFTSLLDETLSVWTHLVRTLNWEHFRQLFRKKIFAVSKATPEEMRIAVKSVTCLSRGLIQSLKNSSDYSEAVLFRNLPKEENILVKQIMGEFYDPIMKILKKRDDTTVRARTGLLESAITCLLCVPDEIAEPAISGTLTSTCQALRAKAQATRDVVRKALSKVASMLGPKYFKFVVKELRSALTRGSQIHVLSYTLRSVMESIRETFSCGDLDESVSLIVGIIMEDTFGSAGSEKDAEGYTSDMREVKAKTSNETAQILSSLISLSQFHYLIEPMRMLLKENLPLKTMKKLDELAQSYSTGLHLNPNSSKIEILILCYEIHSQSFGDAITMNSEKNQKADDHFVVKLNSRRVEHNYDKSQAIHFIQKLSFTILRSALKKNESLLSVSNLSGFLPKIEESLESEDEQLLISVFRILDIFANLPFPQSENSFFERTASRAFEIIQNMPSTANELCQVCLRYMATIVSERGTVQINDNAIVYLLVKLMPDLEDPGKQGRAFSFLSSIVSQHVDLPEVYEVMEKVSTIMIVNHNKTIRDTSRELYFKFLMEYEHSSSKLDRSFKFLVNNLEYPTQSGRQSVMEFMHLIIESSPLSLLEQLATSFFVGLANVAVSDDSSTCREIASLLISEIFKKLRKEKLVPMEKFCISWFTQNNNSLLKRCGLVVYKLYATSRGFGTNAELDSAAYKTIWKIISSAKSGVKDSEADWELVYTSMNVFASMCEFLGKDVYSTFYEGMWMDLIENLLYPHNWVRFMSSRLIGNYLLDNLADVSFEVTGQQIQTVAYRLVRQLNAPGITQKLAQQAVKNLIKIVTRWESQGTPFYNTAGFEESSPDKENQVYKSATDFVVSKICLMMRQKNTENDCVAKLAAIQLGAMISQIASPERLQDFAKQLILGLFMILEVKADSEEKIELHTLARECLKILEERLGAVTYGETYISVRQDIDQKRSERRAQRAQLEIDAPEVAAERRLRKNEKFREKRKHDSKENGRPKSKKRRT